MRIPTPSPPVGPQAGFISCEPLEEAMRFVRAETDLEMARLLEREIAAAELEE